MIEEVRWWRLRPASSFALKLERAEFRALLRRELRGGEDADAAPAEEEELESEALSCSAGNRVAADATRELMFWRLILRRVRVDTSTF